MTWKKNDFEPSAVPWSDGYHGVVGTMEWWIPWSEGSIKHTPFKAENKIEC